jgi:hypothetical protein
MPGQVIHPVQGRLVRPEGDAAIACPYFTRSELGKLFSAKAFHAVRNLSKKTVCALVLKHPRMKSPPAFSPGLRQVTLALHGEV